MVRGGLVSISAISWRSFTIYDINACNVSDAIKLRVISSM